MEKGAFLMCLHILAQKDQLLFYHPITITENSLPISHHNLPSCTSALLGYPTPLVHINMAPASCSQESHKTQT